MAARIFTAEQTNQLDLDGEPALAGHWYFEPSDYDGDVLWSEGFATQEEAEAAAEDQRALFDLLT